MMRRGHNFIVDDRGREFPVRASTDEERASAYAELDEEAMDRFEDAAEPTGGGLLSELSSGVASWLVTNLVIVVTVAIMWFALGRKPWTLVAGMVLGLAIAFYVMKAIRKRGPRVRALAREGICPACEYALRDAVVEADGCTVCPECGAAWRIKGTVGGGA